MRGTIAGSLVSVYMYLQECVCLLDVCGQRNLDLNCSGEAFLSGLVYHPEEDNVATVSPKHWKLRLPFGPSASVCLAEHHQM